MEKFNFKCEVFKNYGNYFNVNNIVSIKPNTLDNDYNYTVFFCNGDITYITKEEVEELLEVDNA